MIDNTNKTPKTALETGKTAETTTPSSVLKEPTVEEVIKEPATENETPKEPIINEDIIEKPLTKRDVEPEEHCLSHLKEEFMSEVLRLADDAKYRTGKAIDSSALLKWIADRV